MLLPTSLLMLLGSRDVPVASAAAYLPADVAGVPCPVASAVAFVTLLWQREA